jgi:hypothetical protein
MNGSDTLSQSLNMAESEAWAESDALEESRLLSPSLLFDTTKRPKDTMQMTVSDAGGRGGGFVLSVQLGDSCNITQSQLHLQSDVMLRTMKFSATAVKNSTGGFSITSCFLKSALFSVTHVFSHSRAFHSSSEFYFTGNDAFNVTEVLTETTIFSSTARFSSTRRFGSSSYARASLDFSPSDAHRRSGYFSDTRNALAVEESIFFEDSVWGYIALILLLSVLLMLGLTIMNIQLRDKLRLNEDFELEGEEGLEGTSTNGDSNGNSNGVDVTEEAYTRGVSRDYSDYSESASASSPTVPDQLETPRKTVSFDLSGLVDLSRSQIDAEEEIEEEEEVEQDPENEYYQELMNDFYQAMFARDMGRRNRVAIDENGRWLA